MKPARTFLVSSNGYLWTRSLASSKADCITTSLLLSIVDWVGLFDRKHFFHTNLLKDQNVPEFLVTLKQPARRFKFVETIFLICHVHYSFRMQQCFLLASGTHARIHVFERCDERQILQQLSASHDTRSLAQLMYNKLMQACTIDVCRHCTQPLPAGTEDVGWFSRPKFDEAVLRTENYSSILIRFSKDINPETKYSFNFFSFFARKAGSKKKYKELEVWDLSKANQITRP